MSEKAYEWIEYKLADGVATITFIAPQFNNALGLKGLQEFLDALYRAEADDAVGAVVVTGRGKAFCAGFNLKEIPVKDLDVEKVAAHFRVLAMWWHQILHLFTRMPKPILAAVNGVAAGSGLGMTLCADMAVCKDTRELLSGVAHHRHRQRRHHQLLARQDRRVPPRHGMDDDQPHGVRERSPRMERREPRLR